MAEELVRETLLGFTASKFRSYKELALRIRGAMPELFVKPYKGIVLQTGSSAVVISRDGLKQYSGSHSDALQYGINYVNKMGGGTLAVLGELKLDKTVELKEDVVIDGISFKNSKIITPPQQPALKFTQQGTGVTFYPFHIRNITFEFPAGGPHKALLADCSSYGCARPTLENVFINGANADLTFDANSTTPHIGVETIICWNHDFENVAATMTGTVFKVDGYGAGRDIHILGITGYKTMGFNITRYRAKWKVWNMVTTQHVRPAFYSEISLLVTCYSCHFEGGGFDTTTPEPVFKLNNQGGVYDVDVKLYDLAQDGIALDIAKVFGTSERWFKWDAEIKDVWQPHAYTITAGNPAVSFNSGRIVIDNSAGTATATVEIPLIPLTSVEARLGGYLKGQGEAKFISGTKHTGIGIDTNNNLYVRMADTNVGYDESIIVDSTGAGEYDVIGYIRPDDAIKFIVYGTGGIYKSARPSFAQNLGFMNITTLQLEVPAAQILQFRPRIHGSYF